MLDEIFNNGLLENVKKQGEYLKNKLLELKGKYPIIKDVRGIGLMQGIELGIPVAPVIAECINNGLLLVGAGTNVIRFVPALIVKSGDIDEAMRILEKAIVHL